MLGYYRSLTPLLLASCLLLTSCANSSLGEALKNSLAADPKLTGSDSSATTNVANDQVTSANSAVQLPPDFPLSVPRYPKAELREVIAANPNGDKAEINSPVTTRWVSQDAGDRILAFYRDTFKSNNWQILAGGSAADKSVSARQNDLTVTVSLQSGETGATNSKQETKAATPDSTTFTIQYLRGASQASQTPSPSPQAGNELAKISPFSASVDLGVTGDSNGAQTPITTTGSVSFTDLNKTPTELRQYVQDVASLGILTPATSSQKGVKGRTDLFQPNKTVTRREYARWLVAANNRLYGDRPTQQIRLGTSTAEPAFRDVPRTDPDFPAIQGLAEAGIIPSRLSGDATVVNFRPNAPLTREYLILWKVPMDTRQALPTANIDAVKQTWGFQDAAKIDPRALRAVLADHQNGDLANIRRAFGYTTLFQPKKPVTRAEAAAALWYFGFQGEGQSAQDALGTGATDSATTNNQAPEQ